MLPPPIRIFATGGTFDKEYNEITGTLFFQETHLGAMLAHGRCRLPLEIETLLMIDSLEMTDTHRQLILQRCRETPERHIIITHGTDSMEVTAAALGAAITDKTIVLTGAMVPYTFGSSDGTFNLGTALAFVQTLPPGVYVAMNGRYWDWRSVTKNRELGIFQDR